MVQDHVVWDTLPLPGIQTKNLKYKLEYDQEVGVQIPHRTQSYYKAKTCQVMLISEKSYKQQNFTKGKIEVLTAKLLHAYLSYGQ